MGGYRLSVTRESSLLVPLLGLRRVSAAAASGFLGQSLLPTALLTALLATTLLLTAALLLSLLSLVADEPALLVALLGLRRVLPAD